MQTKPNRYDMRSKLQTFSYTRPAIPSADGQAPCLQLHRERQQSVTPSIHHLCFWFTSHYVISHSITQSLSHSVTPSLYHQSLCHSSRLHCFLLSLFLLSTPSTLLFSSFQPLISCNFTRDMPLSEKILSRCGDAAVRER